MDGSLMAQIAAGRKLKQAKTIDKSAPAVAGKAIDSSSNGGGAASSSSNRMGKPPSIPTSTPNSSLNKSETISNSSPSMPALGGLFANGMPTLKKAGL